MKDGQDRENTRRTAETTARSNESRHSDSPAGKPDFPMRTATTDPEPETKMRPDSDLEKLESAIASNLAGTDRDIDDSVASVRQEACDDHGESDDDADYAERPLADVSKLEDRIPPQFRTSKAFAFWAIGIGILYVALSYQPLWHTDIWGHVAYGNLILESGSIPLTEPFMPLAEGVRLVDTAWLSQVVLSLLDVNFGTAGLQFFFSFTITLSCVLLARTGFRSTHNHFFTVGALLVFAALQWKSLSIVRPQLAGTVCFFGLIAIVSPWKKSRSLLNSRWLWFAVPALMAVWANLHGSFAVGLLYLVALVVGFAADKLIRTGHWKGVLRDRNVQKLFLVLQLAAVAILLNPYGLTLYSEVLAFGNNPNLQDLVEWDPLTLQTYHGKAAAAVALILVAVYRWSPRRISGAEVLILSGLGYAALSSSRMLAWWAPVAAIAFCVHGNAAWKRWTSRRIAYFDDAAEVEEPRGIWTACAFGAIWCAFAYAPIGMLLLHGEGSEEQQQRRFARSVSAPTPIAATEYLNQMKPQGLVFNSYEWGDYLLYAGPENIQLYTTSHAHLVPREVWSDYMRIARGDSNWDMRLDRYGVNTVIVDQPRRKSLIGKLHNSEDWRLEYEDRLAAIFVRVHPVGVPQTAG